MNNLTAAPIRLLLTRLGGGGDLQMLLCHSTKQFQ